jgi:hypothetical protein
VYPGVLEELAPPGIEPISTPTPASRRVAVAFDELALAI